MLKVAQSIEAANDPTLECAVAFGTSITGKTEDRDYYMLWLKFNKSYIKNDPDQFGAFYYMDYPDDSVVYAIDSNELGVISFCEEMANTDPSSTDASVVDEVKQTGVTIYTK